MSSRRYFPPTVDRQVEDLLQGERPLRILDVGCGSRSPLERLRGPDVEIHGLDISEKVVEAAKASGSFDGYYVGDFCTVDLPSFDVISMFDFIEHLEKDDAFDVLRRAERLASKFVIVMTPTGFVPQGPEHGNEFQRHRSGWFVEDFVGRGYDVEGVMRVRPLYGYGALPRVNVRGYEHLNAMLFQLLRVRRRPAWAFHMLAVKDVRGVVARLP